MSFDCCGADDVNNLIKSKTNLRSNLSCINREKVVKYNLSNYSCVNLQSALICKIQQ